MANPHPPEDLPPIPVPFQERLRDFRLRFLPPLAFLAMAGVIAWMWSWYVQPSLVVGEIEAIQANVVSTVPGTLQEVYVDRFAHVTNGQTLAVLTTQEPELTAAELASMEADLRLLKERMDIDRARNLRDWGDLRHTLLIDELDLAIAQVRLRQAESEFARVKALFDDHLISAGTPLPTAGGEGRNDYGYEVAERDRDALRAEVAERQRAVKTLQGDLGSMEIGSLTAPTNSANIAIEKAI